LADRFNRHFPEVRELAWPEPRATAAHVELELDLTSGLRAAGGDVLVEIHGPPLDRRLVEIDAFDLGGQPHRLRTVILPCATGRLVVDGRVVPGEPEMVTRPDGTFSTAILAEAEVWVGPVRSPGL
jgi:hypothetical protein